MTDRAANDSVAGGLESWKEIAAYLQRDVSTVRRWEKEEGLPVHRHAHRERSSVYAIPAELDEWRAARQPEAPKPASFTAGRVILAASLVTALVGTSWVLWRKGAPRLPYPLVEAAAPGAGKAVARQLWASKTVDLVSGAHSDGRLVVFTDWSTGDLAAIELSTGKQRRLIENREGYKQGEFPQFSVISPDGKLVAYSWWSNKSGNYELRAVAAVEGSKPRTLYSDPKVPVIWAAGWSRDSKQLLAKYGGRIALIAMESGAFREVRTFGPRGPGKMSLSPDGRYIVYDAPQAAEGPERDIFLMPSDGGAEVPLVRHPAHDSQPVWTPDGGHVLFFSDRNGAVGLWSVAVAEGRAAGAPALVQANASQMSLLGFGQDGGLYYALPAGANDLLVAQIDLGAGRLVSDPVPVVSRYGQPVYRPDWSPDGRLLAYVVRKPSVASRGGSLGVVVRDVESGREREMSQSFRTLGGGPLWSPDGKTLLVYGLPAEGEAAAMQLDATDGSARALPGGKTCAFAQWSGASDAVWCLERNGAVKRQTGSGEETGRVQFERTTANTPLSPDGRWMVFRDKDRALNLVAVAGGERRRISQLDDTNDYCFLSWAPDSQSVLCAKGGQAWRIPASGGDPQKLPLAVKGMRDLRIHADGKQVAIWAQEPGSEVWVLENFMRPAGTRAGRSER